MPDVGVVCNRALAVIARSEATKQSPDDAQQPGDCFAALAMTPIDTKTPDFLLANA